jgi:SAM-dependent methyltransferase
MNPRPHPILALAAVLLWLAGCTSLDSGDDLYRPLVGQAGKDVMWVPTLDSAVMPMLEVARVTADDLVYDLGSGDGKIPIWAARQFGARAVGIEYDEKLSALAVRNAERAGVTDRVKMIHGDIFKEDFSQATVLTLYLGRDLNLRLKPTIMKMRPGTRVVSNAFDLGVWEPDRVINLPEQNPIFFWVVPAPVGGEWAVSGLPGAPAATLQLVQKFQRAEGTLRVPGRPAVAVRGRLDGARLTLELPGEAGVARRILADVTGDTFRGKLGDGGVAEVSGRRVR